MSCRCPYEESFRRYPISPARQTFYRLFYLAIVPAVLVGNVLLLIPVSLPAIAWFAALVGVPLLITAMFWPKLGTLEVGQLFSPTGRRSAPMSEGAGETSKRPRT